MADLLVGSDVTKGELVETSLTGIGLRSPVVNRRRIWLWYKLRNSRDGQTNRDSQEHIWHKHLHAKDFQIPHKQVRIWSVGHDDLRIGSLEHRCPEFEYPIGKLFRPLCFRSELHTRLEDPSKALGTVEDNPYGCEDSDGDARCDEGGNEGGGGSGIGVFACAGHGEGG